MNALLRPFAALRIAVLIGLLPLAPNALAERMVFHDVFQNNRQIEHQLSGVNHIVQDRQGFIWFGSEKGLARFDGSHTRIYRHNPSDPFSINHDLVLALALDNHGVMWIGTEGGFCFYRAELDRFTCNDNTKEGTWPHARTRALAFDSSGRLHVGTDAGLYTLSADRTHIRRVRLASAAEPAVAVAALAAAADGTLWIGTDEQGLFELDLQTGATTNYRADDTGENRLAHDRISTLALDSQNRLWVGTYGGGVSILNAARTQFENHAAEPNRPGALSSNIVWDIFEDSRGTIWLAVDQGGLVRFDPQRGFVATRHKPFDRASIPSDQIRTIFEDASGDLWVGAFPSGVGFHNHTSGLIKSFRHEPDREDSLSHSAILSLHKDRQGQIWVGTENGLNLFNRENGSFTRYQYGSSKLTAKAVLSIEQFDEHTLWIGTWSGGLLSFDLRTREFKPIDISAMNTQGKNSKFIWGITRARNGDMWIATQFEGAALYQRSQGRFRFFSRTPNSNQGPPNNFVWTVMEDKRGAIWMATSAGLAVLPAGASAPVQIPFDRTNPHALQAERIVALLEDRRGRIWVGSQDNGVFIYDPETTRFTHIGTDDGLPLGMNSGFVEDSQGDVWILTTNGLVKADGESMHLQVYGTDSGLSGNNFNRDAALHSPEGLLFIGGAEGLNIFDPAQLIGDVAAFPVWVTNLRILNREVGPAEDSPLQQSILFSESIELDHRDTMFSFDFAALDYRSAKDKRYAYMLEGFDKTWNEIGTNRTATYTNIPPGDYRFRVKASLGKDEWIHSRYLNVHIQPAPWRSWWAYCLYLLAIATASYFFAHYFRLRGHTRLYKALSATDPLTGVANRMGVTEVANALFNHPTEECLCVIFIDIDHFKRINDTRGHDSGDRVLQEVTRVLQQCLRRSDLIGRWGGEYLLIYTGIDEANGIRLAEHIRREVASSQFDCERSPLKVTLSLGCAFVQPGESFESAVKRADQALYQAKNAGRNCVVVAPPV